MFPRVSAEEQEHLLKQLEAADEPLSSPYDVRWARRLLAGEKPSTPEVLRQELIEALVTLLCDRAESALLGELAALPLKPLAKAARRGLHRLRSRGLVAEVPAPQTPASSSSGSGQLGRAAEVAGLVTMYDHGLQRVVWLALSASGGLSVYQARVSAEHGLVELRAWDSSRRNYNEAQRKIRREVGAAPVVPAQALWFIHEAAARSQRAQRALPPTFIRSRQDLGAPPAEPHPALALAPAQATGEELAALLELPELSLWLPDRELVQSLVLRLQELAHSRLLIDDQQRQAQLQREIERALERQFVSARNAAYRVVLLDTAHLLDALGKAAAAQLARAGADIFLLSPEQIVAQPLARRFIERVLQLPPPATPAGRPTAGQTTGGGLILAGTTRKP